MTGLPAAELSQIPMSQALAATLARASEGARAALAAEVTLEHLLAALCDDPDAADVFAASNINPSSLRAETINYLSRLTSGDTASPREVMISAGVRRILEAAAAAARGGRRRDINGAIVLAAIVGDGRSAAAQILQVRGLTFDGAIRALQSAMAQPSRDNAPPGVPAEDVLARARERVQSRATPSLRDIMSQLPRAMPQAGETASPQTDIVPSPNVPQSTAAGPQSGTPRPVSPEPEGHAPAATVAIEKPFDSSPPSKEVKTAGAGEVGSNTADVAGPASESAMGRPAVDAKPTAANAANSKTPAGSGVTTGAAPVASKVSGSTVSQPVISPRPAPPPPQHGAREVAKAPHPAPVQFEAHTGGPPDARKSTAMPPPIPPPIPQGPQPGAMPMPGPKAGLAGGTASGHGSGHAGGRPGGQPTSFAGGGQAPATRIPMPPSQRPQAGAARPPQPGGPRAPASDHGMRAPAPRRDAPAKADIGELAENVPRSMRVGVSERVEIRIARGRVKALTEGMEGGGLAWRHDVTITKAMSVRLRAPDGGFFIETASPETQWIDSQFQDVGDDYASWRFQVTPNRRGWAPLQIIVSARTVGADGLAAETAFPDQVIEVKVKSNLKRTLVRWSGWIAAAVLGGVLARFGEGAFEAGSELVAKFMN